tara:strand:- start:83 stop:667 length:585 start_codon:yes stop_codon:yes gene_type:complete
MGTLNVANLNSTSLTSTNLTSTNVISAGTIDFSGSWANAPAGTVIQMGSATAGPAIQTFTSTTPVVITGLSVDFTPRRSDSKIIINVSLVSNLTYVCSFGVYQDGSAVVSTSGQTNTNEPNTSITTYKGNSDTNLMHAPSFNVIIDSGSTAQRTYDVRGTSGWDGTGHSLSVNNRSTYNDMASFSTMVIYEVAQ